MHCFIVAWCCCCLESALRFLQTEKKILAENVLQSTILSHGLHVSNVTIAEAFVSFCMGLAADKGIPVTRLSFQTEMVGLEKI